MGIPVMILGDSGSGKSASMRHFGADDIILYNVGKKPLPFRGRFTKTAHGDAYSTIIGTLVKADAKCYVVDDAQYLMAGEFMRTANQTGYQKFTDIALNFWTLIQTVINDTPEDVIVYFLSHIERDICGNEKMKTIGKMLDEKITLEGLFTIVLKTKVQDGRYMFTTRTSGTDPVKTPIGMFEEATVDNDLKAVDEAIRAYYGFNNNMEEKA